MTSFLSASSLQRDINRKTAMMVNIAYAVLSALKVAVKETRSAPGSLKGPAVEKVMQDLLHVSQPQRYFCLTRTDFVSCLLSFPIPSSATLPVRHWGVCATALEMLLQPPKSTTWWTRLLLIASQMLVRVTPSLLDVFTLSLVVWLLASISRIYLGY